MWFFINYTRVIMTEQELVVGERNQKEKPLIVLYDQNNNGSINIIEEDPSFQLPPQINSRLVCTRGHYLVKRIQQKNGNIYYNSTECNTLITEKQFNSIQDFDINGNKIVDCKRKKY